MEKKWKGASIGGIAGLAILVLINLIFLFNPKIIFYFLKPAYFVFNTILGSKLYVKIFGSELQEVLSLSVVYAIITWIVTYVISRRKDEK